MGFFSNLFGGRNQDRADRAVYRESAAQIAAALPGRIKEILQTEFSEYELKENVPVTAIDPTQTFGGPIDFVLYKDGRSAAAIMLIPPGKKRTKRVFGVEKACQRTGAAYANFRTDFNNPKFPFSREHAVNYLKKNIK